MVMKLAFITYETPFAPSGGIAAVMGRLPRAIKEASHLDVIVLTPFHHRIERTVNLPVEEVGKLELPYRGQKLSFSLQRHFQDDLDWYFLKAEDERFFAGSPHPYIVGETQEEIARTLLRDSLIFGNGAVRALDLLDPSAEWVLFLQDWEGATAALAFADKPKSWRCFITLHNGYDSPVTDETLAEHDIVSEACAGGTVLDRAIPLTERTIFTVSEQFAFDFTQDIFQSNVMVDHLQGLLAPRLLGVNNGPFTDLAVEQDVFDEAKLGRYEPFKRWKKEKRHKALMALEALQPSEERPLWGDLALFRKDEEACWFVMAGRDDTRQKGFDVAAAGVRRFLKKGGQAQFFFFPILGDEGLQGLFFLRKLAEEFPQNVIVFPFRWQEGFFATLQGASFALMPSLYEPFGMANEFYLNGTVGIARATGGIIQQIVPIQGVASFSHAAQHRAAQWHSFSSSPTGILFRERDHLPTALDDWRLINSAHYATDGRAPDRVETREASSLFRSMANELSISLEDGVSLFIEYPERYYSMLTDGIIHIQRSFSWRRAAYAYLRTIGYI